MPEEPGAMKLSNARIVPRLDGTLDAHGRPSFTDVIESVHVVCRDCGAEWTATYWPIERKGYVFPEGAQLWNILCRNPLCETVGTISMDEARQATGGRSVEAK